MSSENRYRGARIACLLMAAALFGMGCSKGVKFRPTALARGGVGTIKVELTYDRNNRLEVKLSNVPDPSALHPQYTRYVLWVADADHQHAVNTGQLRVDDKRVARIETLTPRRKYILFVTAEATGDVTAPGTEVIFESPLIDW